MCLPCFLQLEVSGGEGGVTVDIENNIRLSNGVVHRLTYKLAGKVAWEVLVAYPIIACVANRLLVLILNGRFTKHFRQFLNISQDLL